MNPITAALLALAAALAMLPNAPAADNPKPAPPAGLIQVTVKIDKWHDTGLSSGIGMELCEVTATLVAKNISDKPQTLTFPTAQRYDLVIRDAAGKEI